MSKMSDNYPPFGSMSICDRYGMSGNCGVDCPICQEFECPYMTRAEHCEAHAEKELCNEECFLYYRCECYKYPLKDQLSAWMHRMRLSEDLIMALLNKD